MLSHTLKKWHHAGDTWPFQKVKHVRELLFISVFDPMCVEVHILFFTSLILLRTTLVSEGLNVVLYVVALILRNVFLQCFVKCTGPNQLSIWINEFLKFLPGWGNKSKKNLCGACGTGHHRLIREQPKSGTAVFCKKTPCKSNQVSLEES